MDNNVGCTKLNNQHISARTAVFCSNPTIRSPLRKWEENSPTNYKLKENKRAYEMHFFIRGVLKVEFRENILHSNVLV